MGKGKDCLVLEDGTVYRGSAFGANPPKALQLTGEIPTVRFAGEIVFNTGMTGYHEILTDPSYTGQMVMMTYPHGGNYGDDSAWSETGEEAGRDLREIKCSGFILRSLYTGPVPHGRETLDAFLKRENICGISGIDTRGLTLRLRDKGSCNGIIVTPEGEELSAEEKNAIDNYFKSLPSMEGANLIGEVGTGEACECELKDAVPAAVQTLTPIKEESAHIALLDCGLKANILREFQQLGCRVTLLPSTATAEEVKKTGAQALFLSNGPGDPAPLEAQTTLVKDLLGEMPILGICLGHQVISQALGAKTYKMKFGHHGCNHPVRDEVTGRVFVTSQNHGFAVDPESLPKGVNVRFVNANDGSVEGIEMPEKKVLCVQYHPEAAPGPVDSSWIFQAFLDTIKGA
ncbi:MAG: glutamine-hydrolyzing carbamoyl-phosphate synthase small subunit [Spirochaetales bacterium]|nr:glutamine-hydrolyzing carbamoyl-phosphate synthase small subunit [Spirochaetales bacterium]